MYEIRTAGVKGLGAFAKSAIPRGTRIFAERPLLAISADGDVYGASRRLSPEAREHFMQLSTHISKQLSFLRWIQVAWYTAKHTFKSVLGQSPEDHRIGSKRSLQEHMKALSIFRNNVFDLGNDRRAVFRNISRINHSCIPNAQGNFNDSLDRFTIHATRRIEQGEELTISYLQEHGAMRASRQQRLLDSYGFACACPACDSATKAGRDSDERRSKLHSELAEYAQVEGNTTEGELQLTERFIKLFEDESIAGRELSTMHIAAAKLCQALGRHGEALHHAERGVALDKDCLGTDHRLYQKSLDILKAVKSHDASIQPDRESSSRSISYAYDT